MVAMTTDRLAIPWRAKKGNVNRNRDSLIMKKNGRLRFSFSSIRSDTILSVCTWTGCLGAPTSFFFGVGGGGGPTVGKAQIPSHFALSMKLCARQREKV